jgi:hypothetical protein
VPTAKTRIPTDRAGRYLVQLCQHLSQISGHARHGSATDGSGHPPIQHVEWSDSHGVIEFASGRCTLDATGDTLTVDLSADDASELLELQQMLAARLTTIGRRDNLVVAW